MFSTCIFCHRSLGANEAVEHFPVGRRLAFDAAKGRLWVVCAGCGQWNLTPLEERWEAVEECERTFRDARKRVSTDQIGLARVADGIDLIRIGQPLRPEFAAWRYGERLRARRKRAIAAGVATAAIAGGALTIGGGGAMFLAGSVSGLYVALRRLANRRSELAAAEARLRRITGGDEEWDGNERIEILLEQDGSPEGWQLRIVRGDAHLLLRDSEALHTGHLILPATNPHGAGSWAFEVAVKELEEVGDPARYFPVALKRATAAGMRYAHIGYYPAPLRLAIEMAAHEESERRAMHGELAELERAWREAEEIAKIADDMFLPPDIDTRLRRLRQ